MGSETEHRSRLWYMVFNKEAAVLGAIMTWGSQDVLASLSHRSKFVEATAKFATLHKRDTSNELIKVEDNALVSTEWRMESGTMTTSWTYYGAEDNSTVLWNKGYHENLR